MNRFYLQKSFCQKIVISLILLLLYACTNIPDNEQNKQALTAPAEVWTANGRISIIQEQENWYAKFNWHQQLDDFQISFTGPLGETELQISRVNKHIILQTPAITRSSNDLEQLIYQETGWKLPVNSLRYWLQGLANPNITADINYQEQQISDIVQADWHIHYPKRIQVEQLSGAYKLLPKKIIAEGKNIKIKLIITSWQLAENAITSHAN